VQKWKISAHAFMRRLAFFPPRVQKIVDLLAQVATAEGIEMDFGDDESTGSETDVAAAVGESVRPPGGAVGASLAMHDAIFKRDFGAVRPPLPAVPRLRACGVPFVLTRVLWVRRAAGAVPSRKVRSMFRRRRGDVAALLESTDARGNSPLLLATKLGRTDIASFLVHQGANVEVSSDEHFHLIDEAVATGDREFVRLVYRRLQLRTYEKFVARCPVRRVKRAARDKIIVARH